MSFRNGPDRKGKVVISIQHDTADVFGWFFDPIEYVIGQSKWGRDIIGL